MRDFVTAALPWILIGIALAVFAVSAALGAKVRRRRRENGEPEAPGSYQMEGMCFGTAIGVCFGSIGIVNLGIAIAAGILLGMLVGMLIPKEKE